MSFDPTQERHEAILHALHSIAKEFKHMADSENLHHAYYLEMAQHAGFTKNNLPVSVDKIRKALETDEHLNNIPLHLWDSRVTPSVRQAIGRVNIAKEGRCVSSLSDGVCALKALAKHLAKTSA